MAATTISNKQVDSAIKRLDSEGGMPVSIIAEGYLRAARSAYEIGMKITAIEQLWKAGRMLAMSTMVRRDEIDYYPNDPTPKAERLSKLEGNLKRIEQIGQITKLIMNKESVNWGDSFNIPVLKESDWTGE